MPPSLPTFRDSDVHGVGLGLRWAFLDDVLEGNTPDSIRFFEVSPENYMRRGGFFPEALMEVAKEHPVLTHGLMLNIGSTGPLDGRYLDTLREFLGRLGVTAHSDHLCWNGVDDHMLHDLLPLSATEATIERVADRVRQVQDHLGLPMALENISYYLLPDSTMPEHEMISRLVERAGCDLLLDVNNVWVNARNHGFDPFEYLAQLPLDRVAHLHVAGGRHIPAMDDLVIDTHGTDVSDTVAELMAWVIERIGPRPVLYERDHEIPPLEELGRQVDALNRRYDAALAAWEARRQVRRDDTGRASAEISTSAAPRARSTEAAEAAEATEALLRGFSRLILGPDAVEAGVEKLATQSTADVRHAVACLPAPRVQVYRELVRNGISGTIYGFLPRARSHRGDCAFDLDITRWLDSEGPRSAYVRDLPEEFHRWIAPRWRADPDVPAYLEELARHELLEMAIKEVLERPRPPVPPPALSLDATLEFHASVRLERYSHRVHEVARGTDSPSPPTAETTRLLGYRDREHEARFLVLSELAHAVIGRLLAGDRFGEAVSHAVTTSGLELTDDALHRVGVLINDLVERGVILGVETAGVAP